MAAFPSGELELQANVGNLLRPIWVRLGAEDASLRWAPVNSVNLGKGFYEWPPVARLSTFGGVDYLYAFEGVATGHGVLGGAPSSAPTAFTRSEFMQLRYKWSSAGGFRDVPIITAYLSGAGLTAFSRGDGSLLGGSIDTGSRSYLKACVYGGGVNNAEPTTAPSADPLITSGANGAVSPTTGAWSAWQALNGDLDWLEYNVIPNSDQSEQCLYFMVRLFSGPNLFAAPAGGPFPYSIYTPSVTLKYRPN